VHDLIFSILLPNSTKAERASKQANIPSVSHSTGMTHYEASLRKIKPKFTIVVNILFTTLPEAANLPLYIIINRAFRLGEFVL
jgi:hypothetical protein